MQERGDTGSDFQLQPSGLHISRKCNPVFLVSHTVDPAPDMKVELISLHRQSKLSG